MFRFLAAAAFAVLLISCSTDKESKNLLKTGIWRATVEIQGQELPFNFDLVNDKSGGYDLYIINASERLLLDEVNIEGDSVDIALHVFDANIKAKISGDSLIGTFIKNYDRKADVPFLAVHGQGYRFKKSAFLDELPDFSGKYDVDFITEDDTTRAIGIFNQVKDSVTGTFLTETGDYRYLQGNVSDGMLKLSTFDGNHTYLFTASKRADGTLSGEHYSGKTYMAFWNAKQNENAKLSDPESLTYLKPGYEKIEFSFPDVNGKQVSLADEKYKNKVVILQLFGTWCPNCMDETKFLAPWYRENKDRGVEIIGLAYERKPEFDYASTRVKKMIEKFDVPYDFVIAGTNNKDAAAKTLPQLNKVVAFPTTIFIGRDGKVKRIHTGFSGPGTGMYYDQFVEHFNELVTELLSENIASK
ncbi:MAG TPA: TlpA disulfide reductase family protein [Chryseosolibacter sp.]